jgi:hypothetical protein
MIRSGFTCIYESVDGEKIVSMCLYHDYVIVATENKVLRIKNADNDGLIEIDLLASSSQLKGD